MAEAPAPTRRPTSGSLASLTRARWRSGNRYVMAELANQWRIDTGAVIALSVTGSEKSHRGTGFVIPLALSLLPFISRRCERCCRFVPTWTSSATCTPATVSTPPTIRASSSLPRATSARLATWVRADSTTCLACRGGVGILFLFSACPQTDCWVGNLIFGPPRRAVSCRRASS